MRKRSVFIFFFSLVFFAGIFYFANAMLDAFSMANHDIADEDLGKGNVIEQKVDDELLFLLMGVDVNEDGSTQHVRSDTMMLCKVNFETGKIDILSIPRDTNVTFDGSEHKINAAHSYGGATKSITVVKKLLGLDIDYYMEVNYDAFTRIIDTIGGIEVNSPRELNYPDAGIHIPKGVSRLDGQNALYFARLREAMGWGDLDRIENQHSVLKIMLDQLLKPSNITKLPQLLEIYKTEVKTNIPVGTLASYLPKAGNFSRDKLNMMTLPGEARMKQYNNGKEISWFYVDRPAMKELVNTYFSDYRLDTSINNNSGNSTKTKTKDQNNSKKGNDWNNNN